MQKIIFSILIIFCAYNLKAQTDSIAEFSVVDLQKFAIENNANAKNANLDIRIAKNKKWETTAIGLPQVSASGEYQNFPEIPTQLMPNFVAPAVFGVNQQYFGLQPIAPPPEGDKMPVQFGSQHNTNFGISVSQLIFSGEYIVGLKASKVYLELSKTNLKKTEKEIKETIEKTYYLILISEESIKVLDSISGSLKSLLSETKKFHEAGFLDETSVEQLALNLKNVESSIISFQNQNKFLYRLLKFQAGIDFKTEIKLSDNLSEIVDEIKSAKLLATEMNINNNVNYQLLQVQENLMDLNVQREKATYLPSLAGYYSYSKKTMSDSFDVFSEDADWYPTQVWGVKLSVPIFSSGKRYAKVKQRQLELEQTRNSKIQAVQGLYLKEAQTKTEYMAATLDLQNKIESRKLSKKIYENTLIKYKAGTESSLMLTQSQNQYFTSLTNYYKSLGSLIDLHIKLKNIVN